MSEHEQSLFRYIEVAGQRLRYLCQGQGAPLVLVHGSCSSLYTWRHNIPALSKHFQVFALDLPGFGFSDKPKIQYTPLMFADTLSLFIERLRLQRVHLVGSSLGASISALVALDYAEKVDRLVLIDPRVYAARPKKWISRLLATPGIGPLALRLFNNRAITAQNVREYYYDKSHVTAAVVDQYYLPLRTPGSVWSVHSVMRNTDYTQLFAARAFQIRQPTLILWGQHDELFHVDEGRRLARDISNSTLRIIPDAGHLPHEEKFEMVNDEILRFLSQPDSARLPSLDSEACDTALHVLSGR